MNIIVSGKFNDSVEDFERLFGYFNQAEQAPADEPVTLVLHCDFLRPNAVALIGAIKRFLEHHGRIARIDTSQLSEKIATNLEQNGFLATHGIGKSGWEGNSIPYREDTHFNENGYTRYLLNDWLGRGWVKVEDQTRQIIAQQVVELYVNVFDHARSPIGVISCGQNFPKRHELTLTLIDLGVGIAHNVRHFTQNPDFSAEAALQWVFNEGNTTASGGIGRGIGLKQLKQFIIDHDGHLDIYSSGAYARIDAKGLTTQPTKAAIRGTLVHVKIKTDATLYTHTTEAIDEPWF